MQKSLYELAGNKANYSLVLVDEIYLCLSDARRNEFFHLLNRI